MKQKTLVVDDSYIDRIAASTAKSFTVAFEERLPYWSIVNLGMSLMEFASLAVDGDQYLDKGQVERIVEGVNMVFDRNGTFKDAEEWLKDRIGYWLREG